MPAKAKRKGAGMFLLNWPPSRGPMPAWMRREPKCVVPELVIKSAPYVSEEEHKRELSFSVRLKRAEAKRKHAKLAALRRARATVKAGRSRRRWRRLQRRPQVALIESCRLQCHVDTVASLKNPGVAERLIGSGNWVPLDDTKTYTVTLTYPLGRRAVFAVKPYTREPIRFNGKIKRRWRPCMSVEYLIWQAARAYRRIYREHKRFGVWGHAIGDLWFESIQIDGRNITFGIGS
jgi:hypothetical protein